MKEMKIIVHSSCIDHTLFELFEMSTEGQVLALCKFQDYLNLHNQDSTYYDVPVMFVGHQVFPRVVESVMKLEVDLG